MFEWAFNAVRSIIGSHKANESPIDAETQQIAEQCFMLCEQINESFALARNSRNPSTKVSRLEYTKARLSDLQLIVAQHPRFHITQLEKMHDQIAAMTKEFSDAGFYAHTDDLSYPSMFERHGPEDLISGWRFSATMQLRTPLRYLQMHGRFLDDNALRPNHQPHGWWIAVLKTNAALGIEIPELVTERPIASEVGPLPQDGGEFLPFLCAVRTIVEQDDSIDRRLAALRSELAKSQWSGFVKQLGGRQSIFDRFFPDFLECLPTLPHDSKRRLWELELTTPRRIMNASDAALLAIKGIGPAKLAKIRAICIDAADPDAESLDRVDRE